MNKKLLLFMLCATLLPIRVTFASSLGLLVGQGTSTSATYSGFDLNNDSCVNLILLAETDGTNARIKLNFNNEQHSYYSWRTTAANAINADSINISQDTTNLRTNHLYRTQVCKAHAWSPTLVTSQGTLINDSAAAAPLIAYSSGVWATSTNPTSVQFNFSAGNAHYKLYLENYISTSTAGSGSSSEATSTVFIQDLGNLSFGLAIIIFLLSILLSGLFYSIFSRNGN